MAARIIEAATLIANADPALVAVFVIDPEAQVIPIAASDQGERVSGVTNLSYVTFPSDIEQDVRRLRELTPFA